MSTKPLEQLAEDLQALPEDKRNKVIKDFSLILREPMYQEIIGEISRIEDDPSSPVLKRDVVLSRVKKFVRRSGINYRIDSSNGAFVPSLHKKMVVKVCFTGIGSEHDEDHYGIVWESKANRDHVIIAATTSYKDYQKYHDHYFNIGRIGFLSGETIAIINQVGPISRKRILNTDFRDPSDNQFKVVFISKEQENRIKDGFRVVCLGSQTLFKYIVDSQLKFIPEFTDTTAQYPHLWRPFNFESHVPGVKTTYYLIDEPDTKHEIIWHRHNVTKSERAALLRNWRDAVAQYDESVKPKCLLKTRQQAIQDAYNTLLSKREHPLKLLKENP